MGKEIKKGNASVTLDQDMSKFFLGLLKKAAPSAEKIMTETLEKIERDAKAQWPKRQPVKRFNKKTGRVYFEDRSNNSWRMFERGIRIDARGNIVVFLKNTAPYSWVIKYGKDPKNKEGKALIEPQGRRVARELLVKPMRKSTRKVVTALSKELFKR
jgi:hypothetical protein